MIKTFDKLMMIHVPASDLQLAESHHKRIGPRMRPIIASYRAYTMLKLIILTIFVVLGLYSQNANSVTNIRDRLVPPIVINTWNFTTASARAWLELKIGHSALDAIEFGTGQCEIDRCDGTVGWGGSPAESGETTLDAMIMDGETYDVGGVGGLRRIKGAASVARLVLERTKHSLLVGEMATKFALSFGFKEESLTSNESLRMHEEWLKNDCQPNYWKNVKPDPTKSCGPYSTKSHGDKHFELFPLDYPLENSDYGLMIEEEDFTAPHKPLEPGHDTIGMVAIDSSRRIAAGTSTNGLRYKILGRVGDSPIPGAGAYAAKEAGAAAATGDGDVMMRFLLSYQAVENLRQGMTAQEAALDVIMRQVNRTGKPYAHAAVIVLSKDGTYGSACCGYETFPHVISDSRRQIVTHVTKCVN